MHLVAYISNFRIAFEFEVVMQKSSKNTLVVFACVFLPTICPAKPLCFLIKMPLHLFLEEC